MEEDKSYMKKLKSDDLDKGLEEAGAEHKYQYILLITLFFLKIVTDSFYCPLPYFLMDPKIKCLDEHNQYTKECMMNQICNEKNALIESTNFQNSTLNETNAMLEKITKKYKIDDNIPKSFSFITQFDIECNYLLIGILASSVSVGSLLSNIIGPILTENMGRLSAITVILIFDIFVKSSMFFIPEVSYLFVIFLLTNVTNNCIYNSLSLYINEMVSANKRGLFFCIFNSMYGISGIIYTIVFNLTFSWKILQGLSIVASVISLLINVLFLKESIRYLYMKNKKQEIFETLRFIAKVNGRLSNFEAWETNLKINSKVSLENLKNNNNSDIIEQRNSASISERNVFSKLFANSEVIYKFMVFNFISLVIISGIIYNAIEIKMTQDTFLYPIIFYFMDFIVIFTTGFIIEMPALGRKVPAIFFSLLAAIFYSVKYVDILGNPSSSRFWIDLIIRQSVGISFNILMEYNLEVYSTDIRATAFNINKIFSRLGDFFTPLLLAKNRALCTLILSIIYLLTALMTLNLKETQGQCLEEEVKEVPSKTNEKKTENQLTAEEDEFLMQKKNNN